MLRLLDSEVDILLKSGFIYLPLLLDPSIEREVQAPPEGKGMKAYVRPDDPRVSIRVDGRRFVQSASLRSLLENYEVLKPGTFERIRNRCRRKHMLFTDPDEISIDSNLKMILFRITPRFIHKNKALQRRSMGEKDILDLISSRIRVPAKYYGHANRMLNPESLRKTLETLENSHTAVPNLEEGPIPARKVNEWLLKALEARIVEHEKERLHKVLRERKQFFETQRKHTATLLYLADTGALEVDGFGFFRDKKAGEYVIYKHTGEYALKDYYGRLYLFPDCRVAVTTLGSLKPFVLDHYKHPFLKGWDSKQEICVRLLDTPPQPFSFSAQSLIAALEEGINALFYGYNSRRGNGYHSLDHVTGQVRTVDFSDYMISKDHPKVAAGEVEVKNDFK